jgi:hypothetical protein
MTLHETHFPFWTWVELVTKVGTDNAVQFGVQNARKLMLKAKDATTVGRPVRVTASREWFFDVSQRLATFSPTSFHAVFGCEGKDAGQKQLSVTDTDDNGRHQFYTKAKGCPDLEIKVTRRRRVCAEELWLEDDDCLWSGQGDGFIEMIKAEIESFELPAAFGSVDSFEDVQRKADAFTKKTGGVSGTASGTTIVPTGGALGVDGLGSGDARPSLNRLSSAELLRGVARPPVPQFSSGASVAAQTEADITSDLSDNPEADACKLTYYMRRSPVYSVFGGADEEAVASPPPRIP